MQKINFHKKIYTGGMWRIKKLNLLTEYDTQKYWIGNDKNSFFNCVILVLVTFMAMDYSKLM